MCPQIGNEICKAFNIVELHLSLKFVEPTCDDVTLLGQRARPPTVVDLLERGALYLVLEARILRMIEPTLCSPEGGVLRFGVEHNPIEVE